jgi:hypothetical protein
VKLVKTFRVLLASNCQLSHIASFVHDNDSGLKEELSRIIENIKDLSKTVDKTKNQINKNENKKSWFKHIYLGETSSCNLY